MEQLIAAHRPDLVVIACNTASTLVLPALRERFKVPFVGTVPAIKPACAGSNSKRVSVLGTEATVAREYTRALIREHGNGCARDAGRLAAACRAGRGRAQGRARRPTPKSRAEIAPCFVEATAPAHRHRRAGLHALSAAARPLRAARALAGAIASIRRRRSRAAWSNCSGPPRPARRALPARAVFTSGRHARARHSPRRWPVSGSPRSAAARVFDTPANLPLETAHLAGHLARAVFRDPRFCTFSQRFLRFGCKTCRFR